MGIETLLDVRIVPPNQDPANPYPEVDRWLTTNQERNGYDPEVLKYPSTIVLEVRNGSTMGYLPIQSAVVLESMALDEKLTPMQRAQATLNLVGAAMRLGIQAGKREVYALVTDEITARAAIASGFELLPYRVIRRKLKVDAEGKLL